MLNELEINGFKTIRHESINLGKVNIFIGGNGVGKSNILEAIGILSACLKRDVSAGELQKKGVRLSVPTLFKSAFKNTKLRSNFDLKATVDNSIVYSASITAGKLSEELQFFSERLQYNNEKIMGRSNHGISVAGLQDAHLLRDTDKTRGIWDRYRDVVRLSDKLIDSIDSLSDYAIYSPQTSFLRGVDIESNIIKPMGLNGGGLAQAVSTVLNQWSASKHKSENSKLYERVFNLVWTPGWTNQFSVKARNPETVSAAVKTAESTLYFRDKFMHATRNYLSAYDSSEGTLYLLFLVVLLLHNETPEIFAIDNIDNALNPAITKKLIETIIYVLCASDHNDVKISPKQIFLTSHNPTSLDAFDIFDDSQRIFVVGREKDGATKINRLQPAKGMEKSDWIKMSGGRNLSELWIEGKIKGALGL